MNEDQFKDVKKLMQIQIEMDRRELERQTAEAKIAFGVLGVFSIAIAAFVWLATNV